MHIVDSHCHLDIIEDGGYDIEEVIQNSINQGVKTIQNISVIPSKFERIYRYTQKYENVFCSIGLHPLYCNEEEFDYELCNNLCFFPKVNAIGECGLDYSRNPSDGEKQLQQKVFLQQIDLADKHNLPLIIHTRDAEEKTYGLLETSIRKRENVKGVMHCFTGTKDLAHAMVDLGFYISFSGIVTFKKKVEYLQELVCELPMDRILVETDAPYLSPEPFRGQKNLPERTFFVVKKIAELRKMTIEDVANQTTENYMKLFNKCKIV